MNDQLESTQILYSELLTECLNSLIPKEHGFTFVSKTANSKKYWYLQVVIGNRKSQYYLGSDSPELLSIITKQKQLWEEAAPSLKKREQMVSMLIAGGAQTVTNPEARVLELLEQAGIFQVGGVLVGSHAFATYANILGVQWTTQWVKTSDIDIAKDNLIPIAITNREINLEKTLVNSDFGFIQIPALNRKHPSTSFSIRNKQLKVELLTPEKGKPNNKPIKIHALQTLAEPVRFLEFILEDTQPAVIIAKSGILVNVPSPARYALHKLVVSQRRIPAFATKSKKDIMQANLLLKTLMENRPGDIHYAYAAATKMPDKFLTQMKKGIELLDEGVRKTLLKILK